MTKISVYILLFVFLFSSIDLKAESLEIAGYIFQEGKKAFVDTGVHVSGPNVGPISDVIGADVNIDIDDLIRFSENWLKY